MYPLGSIKPFHIRPPDVRHPLADEFAQFAWSADFGLATPSLVAKPLYTLCDRRKVTSATGASEWEYRGKYHDGRPSQWMAETEILSSFNKLQLDVFHALWNLYTPVPNTTNPLAKACTTSPSRRRAQAVPNRYHRRKRIGPRDHPGPGLRLPRPVLEGTVRGQRSGGAVTARDAPDGPEHTRATPRDPTPNSSTSVTFLVCNRPRQQAHPLHLLFFPRQQTPPVFGTVFLFFQQSVHPYVAITTT